MILFSFQLECLACTHSFEPSKLSQVLQALTMHDTVKHHIGLDHFAHVRSVSNLLATMIAKHDTTFSMNDHEPLMIV